MNKNIRMYTFLLFSFLILLMLVFPVYSIGNRVYPFILGMPFSFAWVLFAIVIQFVGLVFFVLLDKSDEED